MGGLDRGMQPSLIHRESANGKHKWELRLVSTCKRRREGGGGYRAPRTQYTYRPPDGMLSRAGRRSRSRKAEGKLGRRWPGPRGEEGRVSL